MKKVMCCLLCVLCLSMTLITTGYAADTVITMPTMVDEDADQMQLFGDVIIYKTRIHNGKAQYRRWNETWGYWVDPYWIDI